MPVFVRPTEPLLADSARPSAFSRRFHRFGRRKRNRARDPDFSGRSMEILNLARSRRSPQKALGLIPAPAIAAPNEATPTNE